MPDDGDDGEYSDFAKRHTRRGDPDTSFLAAEVAEDESEAHCWTLIRHVHDYPGLTAKEITEQLAYLGWDKEEVHKRLPNTRDEARYGYRVVNGPQVQYPEGKGRLRLTWWPAPENGSGSCFPCTTSNHGACVVIDCACACPTNLT